MTTLTLSTVVVILYGMVGPHGYGRALALGGATAAGAAFVAGGTAVPTFYAVALGAVVAVALGILPKRGPTAPEQRRLPPGVPLLLMFLGWSAFVTAVAPLFFDRMPVALPTGGVTPNQLNAGVFTASNLAQTTYLVLGICVVVYLARSRYSGPEIIGLAAGLATLLSAWRYLNQNAGVPFPEGVFDNSPFLAYIETAPGGIARFRGILSEPSALAASSLVTTAYMVSRAAQLQGWRRWGSVLVAAIAVYLGVISTSTTFVVAAVLVAAIAGATFAVSFLVRGRSVTAVVSVASCVGVIVALWVIPIIAAFVETSVNAKVSSSSFDERSGADTASYHIFFDTFGFGVGLGANRASSFFAGLLSTTGLVGTLLFAATVATLIYRSSSVRAYRPVIWALVTSLVLRAVAGPEISDSSGILWMSLGLLSHAALTAESGRTPSQFLGTEPDAPIGSALWMVRRRRHA